ncbi:MAG: calcium-binding protein [Pseudomonadota bacterium]
MPTLQHFQNNDRTDWLLELQFDLIQFGRDFADFDLGEDGLVIRLLSATNDLDVSGLNEFSQGTVTGIELLDENGNVIERLTNISVSAKDLSTDNFANLPDVLNFGGSVQHTFSGSDATEVFNGPFAVNVWGGGDGVTYFMDALSTVAAGAGREDTIDYSLFTPTGGSGAGAFDGLIIDLRTSIGGFLNELDPQNVGLHLVDNRLGTIPTFEPLSGINHATGTDGGDFIIGREWFEQPALNLAGGGTLESRDGSDLNGLDGDDVLIAGYRSYGGKGDDLIALGDFGIATSTSGALRADIFIDGAQAFGGSGDDTFVLPNGFMDLGALARNQSVGILQTEVHGGSGYDELAFWDDRLRPELGVGQTDGNWVGWTLQSDSFLTMNMDDDGNGVVEFVASRFANMGPGLGSGQAIMLFSTLFSGIEGFAGTGWNELMSGNMHDNGLRGLGGGDTIFGGGGNDTIEGGEGADSMNGGDGFDILSYANSAEAVAVSLKEGLAIGGDAIGLDGEGKDSADSFEGFEGLLGSAASDELIGDDQDNLIDGGAGDDSIDGESGNDTLRGGAGQDNIFGGGGNDLIEAGETPTIEITYTPPVLPGSASNFNEVDAFQIGETFYLLEDPRSTSDIDRVISRILAEGDDTNTQFFSFFITPEMAVSGQDLFVLLKPDDPDATGFDLTLRDASGVEKGLTSFGIGSAIENNVVVTMLSAVLPVGEYFIEVSGTGGTPLGSDFGYLLDLVIETAPVSDRISTVEGTETLSGGNGNDTLIAGTGNDSLSGGNDSDTLIGGAGADTLNGDNGDDVASYGTATEAVNIDLEGSHTGDAEGDEFISIEAFELTAFDDTFAGDGAGQAVHGMGGADDMDGRAGNDSLYGGAGDDTLTGGQDDDLLMGGIGADSLDGGAGFDIASYASAGARVRVNLDGAGLGDAVGDTFASIEEYQLSAFNDAFRGNVDANRAQGMAGNDDMQGAGGRDTLFGNEGQDTLRGGSSRDRLEGGTDNDELSGGNGRDVLLGGRGNDVLMGDKGADKLSGGRDDDLLDGGAANDRLEGGLGSDIFVFADGHGNDVIFDFDALNDDEVIDLAGVSTITSFADLSGAAQQDGGNVVITTAAQNTIRLEGVNLDDLDAADFVFV